MSSYSLSSLSHAESLVWTGCGISKKAFMADVAQAYQRKTGVEILLTGGGATKGIRSVAAGKNQLGGSCRHRLRVAGTEIVADEVDAMLTRVAWDAIVAITHPSNPVSNISMDDLRKVYKGEINNWAQLGGEDAPIQLVVRMGKISGVGAMFRELVMKDRNAEFPSDSSQVLSSGPLESKVETTPHTLAVDGISSARKRNLKVLSLDGVEPSKSNIASGKYPLYRPLFLVTDEINPTPETMQFVDYVLSDEGQAVISGAGTVNLAEGKALEALWDANKNSVAFK